MANPKALITFMHLLPIHVGIVPHLSCDFILLFLAQVGLHEKIQGPRIRKDNESEVFGDCTLSSLRAFTEKVESIRNVSFNKVFAFAFYFFFFFSTLTKLFFLCSRTYTFMQ